MTRRRRTQIVGLQGEGHVESVTWRDLATGEDTSRRLRHVPSMAGASVCIQLVHAALGEWSAMAGGMSRAAKTSASCGYPRRTSVLVGALRDRLGGVFLPDFRRPPRARPFLLGYVIPLSRETHNTLRKVQVHLLKEVGAHLRLEAHPHITLKQAFPVAALEPYESYLEQLAGGLEPFDIHISGIGFFDEGIVFLDVMKTEPLCSLRSRIVSDLANDLGVLPEPLEDERYHFHATVAHGLHPEHRERARRVARNEPLEIHFRCDTLGLLLHTGREWITYNHSPIGLSR